MFDPFDRKKSPFANVFGEGLAASYLESKSGLKKREDALKRTHKYTEDLQKRQSEHEVDMAEEFGAPSQVDKSWATPVANLAKGLFDSYQAYQANKAPKPTPFQNMQQYKSDNNIWVPPS